MSAIVSMALMLGGCAWLGFGAAEPEVRPVGEEFALEDTVDGPRVDYEVAIEGAPDDLVEPLRNASRLIALSDDPPATVLGLRRRANDDAETLLRVLHSRGYYGAGITVNLDTDRDPIPVNVQIDPGPVYALAGFSVLPDDSAIPDLTMEDLGLELGQPARANVILSALDRLRRELRERGYPFAQVVRHSARVDHAERVMRVEATVDPGPFAEFGDLVVSGLETVREDYVRLQVPWHEGEAFDQRKIQEMRRALIDTGLFRTVTVRPAAEEVEDSRLPMLVEVAEADHRSIGVGGRYSSSLGLGVDVFWVHRNLLGRDETFRAELDISQQSKRLGADFTKPGFLRRQGQFLRSTVEVTQEDFEAYDRTGFLADAHIERRLSPTWTGMLGTSFEFAKLTRLEEGERRSALWGLPVRAWRDATDSRLDPRSGSRLDFAVTPYVGTYDGPVVFSRNQAEGRIYQAVDDDQRIVLAGRMVVGALAGADRRDVPPDKRFYAGGGGSVRGYGFQLATDLDDNNDPIGGKSVFEIGAEVRWQVSETIGIVPFIEGGRAFRAQMPSPTRNLFWGVGLGARYFSPVGPIRFDVAIPLDKREDIDDPYQIYISLGQAF